MITLDEDGKIVHKCIIDRSYPVKNYRIFPPEYELDNMIYDRVESAKSQRHNMSEDDAVA